MSHLPSFTGLIDVPQYSVIPERAKIDWMRTHLGFSEGRDVDLSPAALPTDIPHSHLTGVVSESAS